MKNNIILGIVLTILLFGCLAPKAQSKSTPKIGDSDISPNTYPDDNLLSDSSIVPPPSDLNDSDINVQQENDSDLISEGDIVEPV